MPHVLVAGKLHPSGRAILSSAPGLTVQFIDEVSEESYAPHIADADALLIRTQPMGTATVAKANRLKIVSRHGVGYDAVDVDALSERGIALSVCGDVNSFAVAEHAAMMILAATKRVIRADAAVRRGAWEWRNRLEAREVHDANLLLLGFGRIGRTIAGLMAGFNMTIRAHDPFLLKNGWPSGDVRPVADLNEGLAWADLISISVPHTGKPLIGGREFDAMRTGVVIVNTSREALSTKQPW